MMIVAVVGHGTNVDPDAEGFGAWLATFNVHLLTGGGRGVMEAVCKGFAGVPRPRRRGWSIGVLPTDGKGRMKQGYPNSFVEIAVKTHLHGQRNADGSGGDDPHGIYSRNHINALTADVMVAFPGGSGTYAEVVMAMKANKQVLALVRNEQSIGAHDAAALKVKLTTVFPTLNQLQMALEPLLEL
jgi:predicted Rossmann-fold nucleotide-binding protein